MMQPGQCLQFKYTIIRYYVYCFDNITIGKFLRVRTPPPHSPQAPRCHFSSLPLPATHSNRIIIQNAVVFGIHGSFERCVQLLCLLWECGEAHLCWMGVQRCRRGRTSRLTLQVDRGSRMSLFLLLQLKFSIYDTQRQETKKLQKPFSTLTIGLLVIGTNNDEAEDCKTYQTNKIIQEK